MKNRKVSYYSPCFFAQLWNIHLGIADKNKQTALCVISANSSYYIWFKSKSISNMKHSHYAPEKIFNG